MFKNVDFLFKEKFHENLVLFHGDPTKSLNFVNLFYLLVNRFSTQLYIF